MKATWGALFASCCLVGHILTRARLSWQRLTRAWLAWAGLGSLAILRLAWAVRGLLQLAPRSNPLRFPSSWHIEIFKAQTF